MARRRSASTATTTTREEVNNMATSDMFSIIEDEDTLADILRGARGRGDYKTVMVAFIEAGVRLAQIPLDSGLFEGKQAQTVKTGFDNVKNSKEPPEGSDKVKVVKKNDQIYLVNQAVVTA
jgi:hypothetical protein